MIKSNKYLLAILMFLLPSLLLSNMGEPVKHGTTSSEVFTSNHVKILHEDLTITLLDENGYADFEVIYEIESDVEGKQIPLLFYAVNYADSFTVFFDGKSIKLNQVLDGVRNFGKGYLKEFKESINPKKEKYFDLDFVAIGDHKTHEIKDLKYFHVDIPTGKHLIKVKYRASSWMDLSAVLNKHVFGYSLSPALSWKSFGGIKIKIINQNTKFKATTNLPPPHTGSLNGEAIWEFDHMPSSIISIQMDPILSGFQNLILNVGIYNWIWGFIIIYAIFQERIVRKWRINNPTGKWKIAVIGGSFFFGFLTTLTFIFWPPVASEILSPFGSDFGGGYRILAAPFIFIAATFCFWFLSYFYDEIYKKPLDQKEENDSNSSSPNPTNT